MFDLSIADSTDQKGLSDTLILTLLKDFQQLGQFLAADGDVPGLGGLEKGQDA